MDLEEMKFMGQYSVYKSYSVENDGIFIFNQDEHHY